jgi:protoheme ferro-lyase
MPEAQVKGFSGLNCIALMVNNLRATAAEILLIIEDKDFLLVSVHSYPYSA